MNVATKMRLLRKQIILQKWVINTNITELVESKIQNAGLIIQNIRQPIPLLQNHLKFFFYNNELNKFQDDLEGHDKWLSEKMRSNNKILQGVKEVLEIYDKLEPGHEKLVEMVAKSIHDP